MEISPIDIQLAAGGQTVDVADHWGLINPIIKVISDGLVTVGALNAITSSSSAENQHYLFLYDPTNITFSSNTYLTIFGQGFTTEQLATPMVIHAIYINSRWYVIPMLASNTLDAVFTTMIQDDAVTTVKILDANVTTAKIADLNVTTAKLAANAVTTAKITDLNVTEAKIATGAVTEAKIGAGAVTNAKIGALAVDTAEIAASAIETAKINDLAVTKAKMAVNAKREYFNYTIPIDQAAQNLAITMPEAGYVEAISYNVVETIEASDDLTVNVTIETGATQAVGSDTISGGTTTSGTPTAITVASAPDNVFAATNVLLINTTKTTPGGTIFMSIRCIMQG